MDDTVYYQETTFGMFVSGCRCKGNGKAVVHGHYHPRKAKPFRRGSLLDRRRIAAMHRTVLEVVEVSANDLHAMIFRREVLESSEIDDA